MPAETATAPPPAAPAPAAAPTAPAHTSPAAAVSAAAAVPQPVEAPAAPKPGSARDKLFADLRKKAGDRTAERTESAESPAGEADQPPDSGAEAALPASGADKGKKPSPWKIVDQYKAKVAELERQVAESKTASLAEKEKAEYASRIAEMESKIKSYEDDLRFTNYQKHPEFREKYQRPYEDAWKRAMKDLGELTVEDSATGEQRPVSANDMLELVNLPLGKARELATQIYGDFADDAMAHRKEIKTLFDQQQAALEEARTKGAEWEKQQAEKANAERTASTNQIRELWSKFNTEAVKDEKYGRFFNPVEGDEEGNSRLKKGYEMADKAFSANPLDPRLTPEQRAEIVRIHAAVRNRSAAFGRTLYQLQKAESVITALKKELAQFKSTVPGSGEGSREKSEQPASAKDSVFGALRKLAH